MIQVSSILILILRGITSVKATQDAASIIFDRRYVGVEFSPYVKGLNRELPPLDSYSLSEIKEMLTTIATRFTNVSTFGMGVNRETIGKAWNETGGNSLIATAAAEINREAGRLLVTVLLGINMDPVNLDVREAEIANAFTAAIHANSIFKRTVWGAGYLFTSITPAPDKLKQLLKQVVLARAHAHKIGIKIGTKSSHCAQAASQFNKGALRNLIQSFLLNFDFIACQIQPKLEDAVMEPGKAAKLVALRHKEYEAGILQLNPRIEVSITQTGWPSVGKSEFGAANISSTRNLVAYWSTLGKFASENGVQVQFSEAFDQPWRSNHNNTDSGDANGRFGALAHYGWWKLKGGIYVEKILEPEEVLEFEEEGSKTEASNATPTVLGIVIPLLLLTGCLLAFLVYRLRIAKRGYKGLTKQEIDKFMQGSTVSSWEGELGVEEGADSLPYSLDYEIPKKNLHIGNAILGEGTYGLVLKGNVEIGDKLEEVALKTTKKFTSILQLKNLISELKLMIFIGSHPNIIRLVGAYTVELRKGVFYIAAEFCEKGSLESLLRTKSTFVEEFVPGDISSDQGGKQQVTKFLMDSWVLQMARGMNFLALKNVIHSDLATRNVLVVSDNTIRITDFGLSRRLYEYTQYVKQSQEPLPWRWMAVESLQSLHFSTKSDVWSFGVTAWEIYSMGDIPYPGLSWDVSFVQKLEDGLRMPPPEHSGDAVYEKILECWNLECSKRPTFDELVEFFSTLVLA